MAESGFLIRVLDEQEMRPEIDLEIRDLLCRAFPPDIEVFSQTRYWHGSAPAYSVVLSGGSTVVGYLGIVLRKVAVGAARLKVAGVQNFALDPGYRGKGLSSVMMEAAMSEAVSRQAQFGLLFCVRGLERCYSVMGWQTVPAQARMDFEGRSNVPIPGKNITMVRELAGDRFPEGDIHLGGPDW